MKTESDRKVDTWGRNNATDKAGWRAFKHISSKFGKQGYKVEKRRFEN